LELRAFKGCETGKKSSKNDAFIRGRTPVGKGRSAVIPGISFSLGRKRDGLQKQEGRSARGNAGRESLETYPGWDEKNPRQQV